METGIPDPTLPRYPTINPRPFDIVIEPREIVQAIEGPGRLVLIPGTEEDKIQVTYGLVNSIPPTLSGTALNNDPAPELTITTDTWVYLKDVCVFGSPDSHTITIHTETSATAPTPALTVTGFTSYLLIGSVEFADGVATIVANRTQGDLSVDSFGSINFWWAI